MKADVKVRTSLTYPWFSNGEAFVCGSAFANGVLLRGEDLLRFFAEVTGLESFIARVNQLDGFFRVIVRQERETYAAVDQIRSLPVFWTVNSKDSVTISDYLGTEEARAYGIAKDNLTQIQHSYFISGNDTLLNNTYQLSMGEVLVVRDSGVSVQSRWEYAYEHVEGIDEQAIVSSLKPAYDKIFRQLVQFLDGRQAVIPLSGGHDSRLIAYYLKKILKYDNVIAFTYGHPGNGESAVSEKVAGYLGIPWYFVENDSKGCRKLYNQTFRDFLPYVSSAVSLPVLQDYYALHCLVRDGVVKPGSVVIPGHLADVTAGSHLPKIAKPSDSLSREALFNQIYHWHYRQTYCTQKTKRQMIGIIAKNKFCRGLPETMSPDTYDLSYERYFIGERTSKYIVNSARAYEYLSLLWYMPGATKTLSEAWRPVPNHLRRDRMLYQMFERSIYDDGFKAIPFFKEAKSTRDPKSITGLVRFVLNLFFPGSYDFKYISLWKRLRTHVQDLSIYPGAAFRRDYIKILKGAAAGTGKS